MKSCNANKTDDKEPQTKKKKRDIEDETEKPNKKQKTYLNIYTDGGCINNGSDDAIAGYGVYFEGNEYNNISKRIDGLQTNNRAELTAILEALKTVNSEDNIIIHTDSEYCIKGIKGINKINKNGDLFKKIKELVDLRDGDTIFKKVLGHSGNDDGNSKADNLATQAILNN